MQYRNTIIEGYREARLVCFDFEAPPAPQPQESPEGKTGEQEKVQSEPEEGPLEVPLEVPIERAGDEDRSTWPIVYEKDVSTWQRVLGWLRGRR